MADYKSFYEEFITEVRNISRGEVSKHYEDGRKPEFLENAFTELFLAYIEDRGIADGANVCHFEAKTTKGNVKSNAWAYNDDEYLLTLCITLFSEDWVNKQVSSGDVDTALKQLVRTFDQAISGYCKTMEPSSESHDLLKFIYDNKEEIINVEFILLTNGFLPKDFKIPKTKNGEFTFRFDCWDLKRLHRIIESERPYESTTIDLITRFGKPISCLNVNAGVEDHKVFLAVIPGLYLCDLYEEYGHKLLDLNVRSFLQVKNKVNKGIKETLCTDPSKFLAFNNGISATVESVEFEYSDKGLASIKSVTGFQVVNGGQTMACIHWAAKKEKADISQVFVQAKITQVDPDRIQDLAPLISRYANSQNAVNDADFSSNDPIHTELQRLSEKIWAPGEQTRWYYERTRGQYQVEENRKARTIAQKKKFEIDNPKNQKIMKVDMAKFENSWDQYPHLVSLGAQKNFVNFMNDLKQEKGKGWLPDETFYKRLVAKAIIFKTADKAARLAKIPSYKANVVTYMIAYLSKKSIGRLSLEDIWDNQKVSKGVSEAFQVWVIEIHDALVSTSRGRNTSEWSKKNECWEEIQDLDLELPDNLRKELEKSQPMPNVGMNRRGAQKGLSSEDNENLARTLQLDDKTWFEISSWGRRTKNLEKWQCSIAITLSGYAQEKWEKVPSAKQAKQAVKMIEIAIEKGMPGLMP